MEGIKDRIDAAVAAVLLVGMQIVLKWIPLAFGAASILYVGYFGLKQFGPDNIKYGLQYDLNSDHVHISNKPHDCDWDTAPLGRKNCRYEKVVSIQRSEPQEGTIKGGVSVFVNGTWVPVLNGLITPKVGTVVNGYVYRGDNPADKNSWIPVIVGNTQRVIAVSVTWQKVSD
jgi:hypothetical protein